MTVTSSSPRVVLGGAIVDLRRPGDVVSAVRDRLTTETAPLAVASANLDHVHHFGSGGASRSTLTWDPDLDWLVLLDGVPLVRRAARITGASWPRLAGSDLLPSFLEVAASTGSRVGFLGGRTDMHERLRTVLARRFPALPVAGYWAPTAREIEEDRTALANTIHLARVDLLVVSLGKPCQERWIQHNGRESGARVLLAFGAAADFLAGTAKRAPEWMRRSGTEWVFRLLREPRRMGRRYFVQGPPALWRVWTDSGMLTDLGTTTVTPP